jgi:hypothetical protein
MTPGIQNARDLVWQMPRVTGTARTFRRQSLLFQDVSGNEQRAAVRSNKASPTEDPTMVQAANLLTFHARLPSEAPEFGIYRGHGRALEFIHILLHNTTAPASFAQFTLDAQWGGMVIRRPVYIDNVPFIRTDFTLAKPTPHTRGT